MLPIARKLKDIHNHYIAINKFWETLTLEERNNEVQAYVRDMEAMTVYNEKCIDNLVDVAEKKIIIQYDLQGEAHQQLLSSVNEEFVIRQVGEQLVLQSASESKISEPDTIPNKCSILAQASASANLSELDENQMEVEPLKTRHLVSYEAYHSVLKRVWNMEPIKQLSKEKIVGTASYIERIIKYIQKKDAADEIPERAIVSCLQNKLDITSQVSFSMWIKSNFNPTLNDLVAFLREYSDRIA